VSEEHIEVLRRLHAEWAKGHLWALREITDANNHMADGRPRGRRDSPAPRTRGACMSSTAGADRYAAEVSSSRESRSPSRLVTPLVRAIAGAALPHVYRRGDRGQRAG
jgi:hypothetical protein